MSGQLNGQQKLMKHDTGLNLNLSTKVQLMSSQTDEGTGSERIKNTASSYTPDHSVQKTVRTLKHMELKEIYSLEKSLGYVLYYTMTHDLHNNKQSFIYNLIF